MQYADSIVAKFCLGLLVLVFGGCVKGNGEIDPSQTSPSPVTQTTTPTTLGGLVATPAVLMPGQNALLTATASNNGATLSYYWHATQGTLGNDIVNPASWTAPNTEGSYSISVDISDGSSTVRGYVTVVVSVSPVPLIVTSVLPAEAKVGDTVRILGAGFGAKQGTSTVTLGGVAGTAIQSWSDTEIQLQVPNAAVTGDVIVNVGGVKSTAGHLTVFWTKTNWSKTNQSNVAVSTDSNTQNSPLMVSDSSGGAIVVWVDYRNGNADLYAQRLDSSGKRLWTSGGVTVCSAAGNQLAPQIMADGSGGAIVVWHDYRDGAYYNIYAQRLDKNGNALWASNGIAVAGMSSNQTVPHLASDGSGGTVVVWQDYRSGTNFDIYAQRLDSGGTPQWAVGGISIVSAVDNQFNSQIISDGAGGAIVIWEDYRSGLDFDIFAQRIDSTGATQWTLDGISISSSANNQTAPQLTADGSGGAVLVWQDYRSGSSYDIYAQHVDSAGVIGWTVNGVLVSNAANYQVSPQIAASGQNMFIVVWEDYRNDNADLFAQRIDNLGVSQWTANGVAVTTDTADQKLPQISADGANGAFVAWEDRRKAGETGVYAQRIGPTGGGYWTAEGVAISTAAHDQLAPQIIADGAGGAILVWEDRRNNSADIFAQGISAGGNQ